MHNDELQHYGVLGMKWGVHKAPDYQYTSRLTKKYGHKADKFASKGNSYTRILAVMGGQGAGNRGKKAAAGVLAAVGGWPVSRIMNSEYVRGKISESDFSKESLANRAGQMARKADNRLKKMGL